VVINNPALNNLASVLSYGLGKLRRANIFMEYVGDVHEDDNLLASKPFG
jgi:hypothetical protein